MSRGLVDGRLLMVIQPFPSSRLPSRAFASPRKKQQFRAAAIRRTGPARRHDRILPYKSRTRTGVRGRRASLRWKQDSVYELFDQIGRSYRWQTEEERIVSLQSFSNVGRGRSRVCSTSELMYQSVISPSMIIVACSASAGTPSRIVGYMGSSLLPSRYRRKNISPRPASL